MHTCPFCGEECDCDMDDCGGLPVPDDCPHVCEEPEDDWDNDDGWEEYADYMASRQRVIQLWRFIASWDKGNFWHTIEIKYFPPSPDAPLPF